MLFRVLLVIRSSLSLAVAHSSQKTYYVRILSVTITIVIHQNSLNACDAFNRRFLFLIQSVLVVCADTTAINSWSFIEMERPSLMHIINGICDEYFDVREYHN